MNTIEGKIFERKPTEEVLDHMRSNLCWIINRGRNHFMNEFNWSQSKYDVFNYITHKAKSFDVNKRYRLESFAGEIILN